MPRNRFNPQEKLKIVKEYVCGNTSYIKLGRKYSIDESCIRQFQNAQCASCIETTGVTV